MLRAYYLNVKSLIFYDKYLICIFCFQFQLNDMNLMQVNGVANERIAIPLNGVQKFDLSGRLQKKQYEMDWEQINWVRSVKASDRQIKVTVNFT